MSERDQKRRERGQPWKVRGVRGPLVPDPDIRCVGRSGRKKEDEEAGRSGRTIWRSAMCEFVRGTLGPRGVRKREKEAAGMTLPDLRR